jgi:hypothetical protein
VYVVTQEPEWLPLPYAWTLMDAPTGTETDAEIVQVVLFDPPTIVHVKAVGDHTPPEMMPTVATWFVPLVELIVKVNPVKCSAVPGVSPLAVLVADPTDAIVLIP